jgi:pyruvate dehydrogenase E2 component (dihydrolipoamide acetyltransferase)
MYEFKMPSLGADMDAGTLVEWKFKAGEAVERGQVIAVVETEKGAIDVEIWESGIIDRCLVQPGPKVPVGAVLAMLRTGAEVTAGAGAPAPPLQAEAAESTKPRAAPGATEDWRAGMRRAIAAAMSKSKREIPHYYVSADIDMTRALAWLAEQNAKRAVAQRLLPAVPLMKAVALALREVSGLNGFWTEGEFKPSTAVHLGMAVSMRGGGLIAPAIHDADKRSLDGLMSALRDLIERVRGGGLRSSEMTDATVTLTNLGDMGVERVYGVIYPPQVALIGFGKISMRPWVEQESVLARQIVTATLAADHRASDGLTGARFLSAVDALLQTPDRLENAR